MYVLLIFLISTATLISEASDFFHETNQRWQSTKEYRVNPKIILGELINDPPGTHIVLAEFILYSANFQLQKDCLIFQVPKKKQPGKLYVHTLDIQSKCEDKLLEESQIELKNIFNLAIQIEDQKMQLEVDAEVLNYKLRNFHNDTSVDISLIPRSKPTPVRDGQLCYVIDDSCQVIQENRCEFCPRSYINIVASRCQTDFAKICTSKPCGYKGQPACVRGYRATKFTQDYCINDSPIAFCRDNLRVLCVDGRLICR